MTQDKNIYLDVEQEVQHVAILDRVLLALGAHPGRLPGARLTLAGNELGEGDGLGADEGHSSPVQQEPAAQ